MQPLAGCTLCVYARTQAQQPAAVAQASSVYAHVQAQQPVAVAQAKRCWPAPMFQHIILI